MKAGSSIKVTPSIKVEGECFFCRFEMGMATCTNDESVGLREEGHHEVEVRPYFIMLVPVISRTGRVTGEGRYTMVCDRCEATCSELKGEGR